MILYNRLSNLESINLLNKSKEERLTLSFYKYFKIDNLIIFRNYLFSSFSEIGILGRIYVANEGINAQLSLPNKHLSSFEAKLDEIEPLKGIRLNFAIKHNPKSFLKLKIKVRNQIVVDGISNKKFDHTNVGKHVEALEFNNILSEKETACVDMRNHYESEIGHFMGAIIPNVDSFKESIKFIDKKFENENKKKKILLYCTGGIRCEKASAYLKFKGFKNVYQLDGGIINYAHQVKKNNYKNKFIGKNFVFDNRLSENITNDVISNCHQCGTKSDDHVNCSNVACNLLFIQCKSCNELFAGCCSIECQKTNNLSLDKQKSLRKGEKARKRIFKKI
ncbi:MAG: rhodanese-related sulfurtransferase [Flavobacteriaceae bacterium]|tara:strand:- start:13511 stop:14515 length:1005 start_codon:yes stop_codon:yes gene_type:complete